MSERRGPQLPFSYGQDEVIENFVGGLSNGQVQVIGPELVYGSLYDHIGYGPSAQWAVPPPCHMQTV